MQDVSRTRRSVVRGCVWTHGALVAACLAIATALAGPAALRGQDGDGFEVAVNGGLFAPQAPSFAQNEAGFSLDPAVLAGARLGYQFPFRVFLQGDFGYSPSKLQRTDGETISLNPVMASGTVGYSIPASPAFQLLLAAGAGAIGWSPEGLPSETDLAIHGGLGARISFSPAVAVRLDVRDRYAPNGLSATRRQLEPGLSHEDSQGGNHNLEVSAGLSLFVAGAAPDSDRDGVANDRDLCPDTPLGARIDAGGCPVDGDGDRVADHADRCPATPSGATVDATGCPMDGDRDGVPDGLDTCPATPGGTPVDEDGCAADGDGDGVPDASDACPGTATGVAVDDSGCALDEDGDGVPDHLDRCAGTEAGAAVGDDGCALSPIERQLAESGRAVLTGVSFASGSAGLSAGSRAALDAAGRALVRNPGLQVEVRGHTDATGAAELNRRLSEQRARAVVDYLVGAYPALRGRLVPRGMGEVEPIASNRTEAGRAQNRRIELVVVSP